MILKIKDGNQYFWIIFHILLGIAAGLKHEIVTAWIYIIVASTLVTFFNGKKYKDLLHYFFAYMIVYEIAGRVLRLSPFIPIEIDKYLSFAFLMLGILAGCRNVSRFRLNTVGLAICFLSLPSIFLMKDYMVWDNLIFNWLGIFTLGLFTIYFSNYVFNKEQLKDMLRLMVYPVLTMTAFLFFTTPSISQLKFDVGANAAASGHYGPNQVSSMYGLGIFALGTSLILSYKVFKNFLVEVAMMLIFFLRGMLTFSRGGMTSAVLALIVIFLWGRTKKIKWTPKKVGTVMIISVFSFFVFNYINQLSGNTLLSRFSNETAETSSGAKERDLNTMTDGRSTIMEAELKIFSEHPLLGVGPGQSRFFWDINSEFNEGDSEYVLPAHTEMTRLLAEHGILGLIIDLLLLFPFVKYWVNRQDLLKRGYGYYFNIAFLVFAISMCLHSAMRTMMTPFFYGLAYAGIRITDKAPVKKSTVKVSPAGLEAVPA